MEEKKKRGRPAIQPDQRLVLKSYRFKKRQIEKIDRYGAEWLRLVVDRAKPPKSK